MKKNILDDEYKKFVKLYQYYIFENQFENFQKKIQKYEKFYDNNFYDYNDINDIYFVNKKVKHLYNKCDISFSSKNKLFKHLQKTYRKSKIFDAIFEAFEIISEIFETIFEIFETIFKIFDAIFETYVAIFEINKTSISFEKFVIFIINNVKIIIIIHFIIIYIM